MFLACIALTAGCAENRQLMPTPNLYAHEKATLFGELRPEFAGWRAAGIDGEEVIL